MSDATIRPGPVAAGPPAAPVAPPPAARKPAPAAAPAALQDVFAEGGRTGTEFGASVRAASF